MMLFVTRVIFADKACTPIIRSYVPIYHYALLFKNLFSKLTLAKAVLFLHGLPKKGDNMKCLELTRKFYVDCVLNLMKKYFPSLAENHSAALLGWGSEVLENDDDISKFYGWGPKPKIFLSNKDYIQSGDKLWEMFLDKIPIRYQGHLTRFKVDPMDDLPKPTDEKDGFPMITISTFERLHTFYIGDISIPYSDFEWLLIPEQKLLEITSGEVFYDGLGILNDFRKNISYYPENVWKYKLAYQWTTLNWKLDLISLCNKREDVLSSRLSINETVQRIIGLIFLLNKAYKPGYIKWIHRQLYKLTNLAKQIGPELDKILTTNDCEIAQTNLIKVIETLIEYQINKDIISRVDYKQFSHFSRGFSPINLDIVIKEIKKGISGELAELPFPLGTVDQWVTDEDLLLSPNTIKNLRSVYFSKEPERKQLGDKGL